MLATECMEQHFDRFLAFKQNSCSLSCLHLHRPSCPVLQVCHGVFASTSHDEAVGTVLAAYLFKAANCGRRAIVAAKGRVFVAMLARCSWSCSRRKACAISTQGRLSRPRECPLPSLQRDASLSPTLLPCVVEDRVGAALAVTSCGARSKTGVFINY